MNKKDEGLHSKNSVGTIGENKLKSILGDRWRECSSDLGDGKIDFNNKEYFYELKSSTKKFSDNIRLNQVRAIKCIPLIIYSDLEDRWAIVSPKDVMKAASTKKRGQHSELFFECCQLSNKNFNLNIIENKDLIPEIEKMLTYMESDEIKKLIIKAEEIKSKLQDLSEKWKKEIEEVINES